MAESPHSDFVLESREHLLVFERSMLALEKATGVEVGNSIDASFRSVHSIKGNAGFLGFHKIQNLSHATESVLETYRIANSAPPTHVVELLLLAVDRLSAMIEDLEHSDAHDISQLLERLFSLDSCGPSLTPSLSMELLLARTPSSSLPLVRSLHALGTIRNFSIPNVDFQKNVSSWSQPLRIKFELNTKRTLFHVKRALEDAGQWVTWSALNAVELDELSSVELANTLRANLAERRGALLYEPVDFAIGVPKPPILWFSSDSTNVPAAQPNGSNRANELRVVDRSIPTSTLVPIADMDDATRELAVEPTIPFAPVPTQSTLPPKGTLAPHASDRISSLRIQVDLLDRLMNLVGELTLVRNQSLLAFGETDGTPRAIIQQLNSVTSDLQVAVLETRMQPVGNLFGRFPRMVRDLSKQLGKQVEMIMLGQEVELDKTVLEQLSDPLTHLIRNSIDHGLETPEVRQKSGKFPVGKVTLSAIAADGLVIIEISDDGHGIDPNAVRAKLVSLGMKTESELQRMSPKELYSHILLPGFSTAKQVSDVSGRGVGMDVVKTNIERLGGSLTIDSTSGIGTSIMMRVPLTLAIIRCLIVTVGERRFAIPQRGLEEIVCLYPGSCGSIEQAYDSEQYRLRDLLLPVIRFNEILKRKDAFDAETKAEIIAENAPKDRDANRIEYILVLRTADRKFGLLVDDVRGTEEVVIKPMHPSLKNIGIFAGATLMGDGKVALIANVDGIAEHADCYGVEAARSTGSTLRDPAEVHRVLLFKYGPKEQFAVPLVQVRRIESISMDQIEHVGDQEFINVDGKATRMVRLDRYLNVSACESSSNMHLLLPKFVAEPMGILVSHIVDTESLAIDLQAANVEDPGILGTAIVRGKLSLFVDTQYLREQLFGKTTQEQGAK